MFTKSQCLSCVCAKCKHEWTTKNLDVPSLCAKCKTAKWNADYTPPEPPKTITLLDRVKALLPSERLELFSHFELCCGMNAGECICEPEYIEPQQSKLEIARAALASVGNRVSVTSEPVSDANEWIDAGEHWNEIQGEMVAMERHYKTGKYREKQQ